MKIRFNKPLKTDDKLVFLLIVFGKRITIVSRKEARTMSKPKSDGFEYLLFGVMFLYMFNEFSLIVLSIFYRKVLWVLLFNAIVLTICLYRARHIIKHVKAKP